jgi:hypothetical protein
MSPWLKSTKSSARCDATTVSAAQQAHAATGRAAHVSPGRGAHSLDPAAAISGARRGPEIAPRQPGRERRQAGAAASRPCRAPPARTRADRVTVPRAPRTHAAADIRYGHETRLHGFPGSVFHTRCGPRAPRTHAPRPRPGGVPLASQRPLVKSEIRDSTRVRVESQIAPRSRPLRRERHAALAPWSNPSPCGDRVHPPSDQSACIRDSRSGQYAPPSLPFPLSPTLSSDA